MEYISNINDRDILYQKHDLEINWSISLPDTNWLFVALVESDNLHVLDEIARKIIDNDVCYACCIGTFGEKMHDLIDENLVIRETEIEKLHFPDHQVMTTWHRDIDNGLWFALYSAFHESELIDKVFCLEIGKDNRKAEIIGLIDKFKQGYIPEDE